MGYGKITRKQQEILDYIKEEILTKGYPPAVREICEAVQLKSTSSVHSHLETLEKNGYIRRDPTKPRAIEICDDNFQMVRTEMVSLPVIGRVAAGSPILAEENIESYFPVPADMVPAGDSFVSEVELQNPAALLHAKAGSFLARKKYGVTDDDILNAIKYHTTGRPEMSKLEKILYIADYIEPGRKHAANLLQIRKMAYQDLDQTLFKILEDTLSYLLTTGGEIDSMTQETYDYYKRTRS